MKKCLYCRLNVLKESDSFCSKECKIKFNSKIDNIIPVIKGNKKLTNKEIELQKEFLRNKKATQI